MTTVSTEQRVPTRIAVIGGSGLSTLFENGAELTERVATPYGTAEISVGMLGNTRVAFLARHGAGHTIAPHLINFRANIWALASRGVRSIISSAAVGGLSQTHPVDSLVLTDQYLNFTQARNDTFYDSDSVQHLQSSDPFCPTLHANAVDVLGNSALPSGTVAVIQGPRFSTRAESRWLRDGGADMVNMTLYPEVPLASELNIGTINLAYVTDSDAKAGADAVSADSVFARLAAAKPRILAAIEALVRTIPEDYQATELINPDAVAAVLARRPS